MKATNLITHSGISVSLLVVVLCAGIARGQAVGQVQEEWAARYNGPGNNLDYSTAIALDSSGNVYVTGASYSGANFESLDYATIKYDSAGNQLWVARYNGPGNAGDRAEAIALDKSGNVYVTGYCDAIVSTWSTTDCATVKYDAAGNQLWAAHYNGPGNDRDSITGIAVDASGNVYITGFSEDSDTDSEYATVKYDTNGNQLWVRRYNGPGNRYDQANGIALDASSNIYVTGYSPGGNTGQDYATIKYDTNGNQLWVARYNSSGDGWDGAYAIALDKWGNVYVTGESESNVTKGSYATIKYDTNGNQLWVARYNSSGTVLARPEAIAVDVLGDVYVTGISTGKDYATIKYDTNGNELWVRGYNGQGNDEDRAEAIALDVCGNVYVTGRSEGRDTGRDSTTIKYDTNGNQLWVARYNGPGNSSDSTEAIVLDASGNVYVTGSSYISGTPHDYVTIKYSQNSQMVDLDCDNDMDLTDFGFFTGYWLETNCGLCGGADLSGDWDVDLEDFAIFSAHWLAGVE